MVAQFFVLFVGVLLAATEAYMYDIVWMPTAENPNNTKHAFFQSVIEGVKYRTEQLGNHSIYFGIFPSKQDIENCYEVHQNLTMSDDIYDKIRSVPELKQPYPLAMVPYWAIRESSQSFDHPWHTYNHYSRVNPFYIVTSSAELRDIYPIGIERELCKRNILLDKKTYTYARLYVIALVPRSQKRRWLSHLSAVNVAHEVYGYSDDPQMEYPSSVLGFKIAERINEVFLTQVSTPKPLSEVPWWVKYYKIYKLTEQWKNPFSR